MNFSLLRQKSIVDVLAPNFYPDEVIDIDEMYAICYLEKFARRLMLAFSPFHLQIAGEVDVNVYTVNIDFELVIETLLHSLGYPQFNL